ncbi:hypothetical protein [Alienimonas californiensis]|uniref:Uncharacterized protein n=1 Tax=Alienimonas californiensis TaxID=2527989 RepID=A0A517P7Z6_9PLAN|nr:hypothetical protein [Alienimonas californiensis]QDT15465.1 hypothetical protein CA12_15500 [Alienimonas californiensis]
MPAPRTSSRWLPTLVAGLGLAVLPLAGCGDPDVGGTTVNPPPEDLDAVEEAGRSEERAARMQEEGG